MPTRQHNPGFAGPDAENATRLGDLLVRHLPVIEACVRHQARSQGPLRESVADVVGAVCCDLLAVEHAVDYRGTAAFHNWLCSVVANKVRSRIRFAHAKKRDSGREVDADAPIEDVVANFDSPLQQAIRSEELERLQLALRRLPPEVRSLIERAHFGREPRVCIAADSGVNAGAVRNRLARAMDRLARELHRSRASRDAT
jgi:RNA polymerase sigma factor (sigma-70 family)